MGWVTNWRTGSARRDRRAAESLARESEAFLSGHLGVLFERDGLPRPAWTWLNTLAHGEPARLASLARYGCEADRPPAARTAWDHAAALLALEMMQVVNDDPCALRCLQREALIPLEAAWLSGAGTPDNPRQLVQTVMATLDNRRRGVRGTRVSRTRSQPSSPPPQADQARSCDPGSPPSRA